MESPLVSVIIPTFNSEKFISDAIFSVQNQSYLNWEIILVDDCSTDATLSIVSEMALNDKRIKYSKLSKNSGTGVARNSALAEAKGKYIAFLDADDLWKANKLELQLNFMKTNKLPFTFSFYDCIDEEGKPLNKRVEAPINLSYRQLFFCNYIGNLTAIYDVNCFGKIPISSIRKRQDWMLWLTVLKKIKVAHPVTESLAYYRVRDNSISTSKFDLIKYNFAVYRKYHGFSFLFAVACMKLFLFTQLLIKPWYIKTIKPSI
ncbi:glycosyltransferase family 2 protein [Flavobacterium degerlachei]|jgi:glycosyltransferase involved in cell wall biosynthesis|uniref:Glycosyltransferase involved in cell wall bisynthesis n=1 Tax=Flavobacterium degerlachei TaxID=229203 RepID=A0A1H2QYP9_9FLAO|nr:glycosyltransferase family 2 protein [Flavobacterium degerlachei]SDW11569.1 Glycosyltransferase involved in cell wall bisynthesis [Flavobacterium degerlachei]